MAERAGGLARSPQDAGDERSPERKTARSRRPDWRQLIALVLAIACFAHASPSRAQTKTGTTFGAFTLIEPDARLAAMGNAGSGAAEGLAGVFHNPGAAGTLQKIGFRSNAQPQLIGVGLSILTGRVATIFVLRVKLRMRRK